MGSYSISSQPLAPKGFTIDSIQYGCFDSVGLVNLLILITQEDECQQVNRLLQANDSIYKLVIANDQFIIDNLKVNLKTWEEVGKITEKQYANSMEIVGNLEKQIKVLKFWNAIYRTGFLIGAGVLAAVLLTPK